MPQNFLMIYYCLKILIIFLINYVLEAHYSTMKGFVEEFALIKRDYYVIELLGDFFVRNGKIMYKFFHITNFSYFRNLNPLPKTHQPVM